MAKDRRIFTMDIEQFDHIHTSVWLNIDTLEEHEFVIHRLRDDRPAYYRFLKTVDKIVGFNSKSYDYKVIHEFLQRENKRESADVLTGYLTKLSNSIIKDRDFKLYQPNPYFNNVDLFKIWHYDNQARSTSLKVLQCSMNFYNVDEFDFNTKVKTLKDIEQVLMYNRNDTRSTKMFFDYSLDKIRQRQSIKKQFGLDCINYSDSLLGEKLLLHFYTQETRITEAQLREVKNKTFYPKTIPNSTTIFPYISFKSEEKQALLGAFKRGYVECEVKLKLNPDSFQNLKHHKIFVKIEGRKDKQKIKIFQQSKGVSYYFGSGGLHGSRRGSFYSDEEGDIHDIDVGSLYPNIAIQNNLFIRILGSQFIAIYRDKIVNVRLASKDILTAYKKGKIQLTAEELNLHNTISDGYKLSANSVFGKSNDINSVLFDPVYTAETTINGQLLLYKLVEDIEPLGTIIQANTDGITIKVPHDKKDEFMRVCNEWCEFSKLNLEYAKYKEFHVRDVNNYIGITPEGKTKEKGAYEVDKKVGQEPSFHKDNSFRVVPLAVREYFLNQTPIEKTILNHTNFYDFLGREKFDARFKALLQKVDVGTDLFSQGYRFEELGKVVRYYVSENGDPFYKKTLSKDNKKKENLSRICVGYKVKIANLVRDEIAQNHDIDYDFYYNEAMKLINGIE